MHPVTAQRPSATPAKEHPSVTALMREAKAGETQEDVVRRKCRGFVAKAKAMQWSGPPFDPVALASALGILVEDCAEITEGEGRIFPRGQHVVIQVKPGSNQERRRFTICHEIAHTCFPDAFEYVRNRSVDLSLDAHKRFENLCDLGAAELLMPVENFTEDMPPSPPLVQDILRLSQLYFASMEATVRRVVDLSPHPCAAVFLTDRGFRGVEPTLGHMRIKFYWPSKTFRDFPKPGTLSPLDSVVNSKPTGGTPYDRLSQECWVIGDKVHLWHVNAIGLPDVKDRPDYPRILALIHGTNDNSSVPELGA